MLTRNAMLVLCAFGLGSAPGEAPAAQSPAPAVIPRPAEMEKRPGVCKLLPNMRVVFLVYNPEVRAIANGLATDLSRKTGWKLTVFGPADVGGRHAGVADIKLVIGNADERVGEEGYEVTVTRADIELKAATARGLSRGTQTLRQLLMTTGGADGDHDATTGWVVPCVHIKDWPRYRWRGMLLDCCRHYLDKAFIKRYIDLLAYHKMNVLHWHLTDDQGWRIEIKKYPRLTEVGAWRGTGDGRYGGFYTQEDVKEIVAYAASRYVTVVPEIEMPGHSLAALAAYPELSCTGGPFEVSTRWGIVEDVYCAGNDQTFAFLEDVLSEVIELFPSEYIHIGGDECPKTRWKVCPRCQARIRAEGLKDESELQSYFIRRIEKFLNSKGRRLIGWDEILEGGLAPNATVQSWRGMKGAIAAATAGHDVICSPTSHCYLDYAQGRHLGEATWMGFCDLKTAQAFEPAPPELTPEQARHVLGAECNMWTEYAPQERVDRRVFPRLCALAEAMWTPAEQRDWDDFATRMTTHYRRLDALGVVYYIPPPRFVVAQTEFVRRTGVELVNPGGRGEIHYTLDGTEPTATSARYEAPLTLTATTTIKACVCCAGGRCGDCAELTFVKREQ